MRNKRVKILLASLAISLAAANLTSGCSLLKKDKQTETEFQTQSESETESERAAGTESETESEIELQNNIAFTSQDRTIRITLPDSTWKVTQDADEMRVFSSGSAAMISIVHAANASAMKTISVSESEEALKTSLTKQYPEANSFEVVEFEKLSSTTLNTYEYVVKYNATSMWAYSVTYGIIAEDEAYVITGNVTDDNKMLMEAVKKAVESFTVLRNAKFSAIPGTVVNQKTSESQTTQSESQNSAEAELGTLKDYGTTATLYASETVNIRLQPTTETDNVIGSLNAGDQVTVIGETSQWFKVNINGHIGYINKAFLVNTPKQTETTAQSSNSEDTPDSTKVAAEMNSYVDYGTSYTYYTTTDVNLRSEPGISDNNWIGGLGSGVAVSVIGETDNWFVVSVNGTTGYISKSYISQTNTAGGGDTGHGNTTDPGDAGTGSSTPTTGTGTISGTVEDATVNTLKIKGDDGNTYYVNYADANLISQDGIYEGVYVTATVDYSGTLPSGELYATSVSGN